MIRSSLQGRKQVKYHIRESLRYAGVTACLNLAKGIDPIKHTSSERSGDDPSRQPTIQRLLNSVAAAYGADHQKPLKVFRAVIAEAWTSADEKWPPCDGPIHERIKNIFKALCKALESLHHPEGLGTQQGQRAHTERPADVLVKLLEISLTSWMTMSSSLTRCAE